MTQFKWSSVSFTQQFLDLAVLVAALATSVWISHLGCLAPKSQSDSSHFDFAEVLRGATFADFLFLVALLLSCNLCLSSIALYGSKRLARRRDDLVDVMRAVGLCTLTLAALAQVFESKVIFRGLLLSFWLLASIWLFSWRWLKQLVLREARLREIGRARVGKECRARGSR